MHSPDNLQCSYNPLLVLLSYLISVAGSYCALDCGLRLRHLRGRSLAGWLGVAALAMGGGAVWSMHFIAMAACRLPVTVSYDPTLTLASFLVAVVVTGVGLYVVGSDPARLVRLVGGGGFMGIGIAAMHYTGMAAMRLPAAIAYDPVLVVASFLIAIAAAQLALWSAFNLRRGWWPRIGSALVMAGAVCGMHYTGMTAAVFVPNQRPIVGPPPALTADELGYTVFWVTLLALALILMESRLTDARRVAGALRESEQRYRAMFESAQALAARLTAVRDEEAARIAREVHDELGQALTTLGLDVAWLRQKLAAGPMPAAEILAKLSSMSQMLETTMDAVSRITTDLRPAILDRVGLEAAIEWYVEDLARRTGVSCRVRCDLDGRTLDPVHSTAVFRILQETLTNVTRHAGAKVVDIGLQVVENRLVLEVVDDGKGIAEGKIDDPRSLGLLGMHDRARALGGDVQIRGRSDHGTVVEATIPL